MSISAKHSPGSLTGRATGSYPAGRVQLPEGECLSHAEIVKVYFQDWFPNGFDVNRDRLSYYQFVYRHPHLTLETLEDILKLGVPKPTRQQYAIIFSRNSNK